MRIRIALIATLLAGPALAQQDTASSGALANRIAAATEALSQYRALDNGVWASFGGSTIKDRRPDLARKVTVTALQFGYDHRFTSAFTRGDQLVLGVAGGVLNASSRADAGSSPAVSAIAPETSTRPSTSRPCGTCWSRTAPTTAAVAGSIASSTANVAGRTRRSTTCSIA